MRTSLRNRIFVALAAVVMAAIAGCALEPRMDGGIVGTGNRVDCDAQAKKDATQDCKPQSGDAR